MGFEQRKAEMDQFYERWAEGDFGAVLDFEFGFSEDFPEAGTSVGAEENAKRMAGWLGGWDDWKVDVTEYLDAGDKVVALIKVNGRGKSSGIDFERICANIWRFEGDRPTSMIVYYEPENALRDAGLASA